MAKGKGQIKFASDQGDRGIPKGSLPKTTDKKGTIQFSGQGGDQGIPKKAPGSGKGASWAGTHD